jgi:hypothetical protein
MTGQPSEQIATRHGYVALLDVLGFRELVSQSDKESRLSRYIETVRRALQRHGIEFVLFSDAIVINTVEGREEPLIDIVVACSNLMFELGLAGIAVRGSIGYGPFVKSRASSEGVFVAGRPIVETHHYETQQDWVGVMLAPSVVQNVPDVAARCAIRNFSEFANVRDFISNNWLAIHLQPFDGIPFHDDELFDGCAVVPMVASPTRKASVLEALTAMQSSLTRMKALAPNPAAQRKYRRTILWLQKNELWSAFGHLTD